MTGGRGWEDKMKNNIFEVWYPGKAKGIVAEFVCPA